MQVIRWLEQYLTTQDISVVVVTHDRAFMEAVCTSVLELESGEVTLHNFGGPGSYDRFRQVCLPRAAVSENWISQTFDKPQAVCMSCAGRSLCRLTGLVRRAVTQNDCCKPV